MITIGDGNGRKLMPLLKFKMELFFFRIALLLVLAKYDKYTIYVSIDGINCLILLDRIGNQFNIIHMKETPYSLLLFRFPFIHNGFG